MGDQSLIGIAAVVSGEKDPRNLMLVFSMLRVIMVEWDISKHSDIMFDSVYAYFPITFRPPPNDPYGITAQDLKDRLRDCIASTGALAPHSIPNLIERLDATSVTVKRDVLQALAACALNYDPETIVKYSNPLWESVKFEILQAQEPELADEALVVVKNIAVCISGLRGPTPVTVPLFTYLKPITTESLDHLKQPASRQANASGDILKAAASGSVKAHTYVTEKVGPNLLTTLQASDTILQQRAILEVTNKLFEAAIEVYGSRNSPTSKHSGNPENALGQLKDNLVAVYSQALMGTVKEEVSFRLTAAKGLLLFAKMRSILEDSEVGLFVHYFDDIVLKEESYGKDELKQVAIGALAEISTFKPRLVSDISLPAFMACMPETEEDAAKATYQSVLNALAELSIEKDLLQTIMRRLLGKLDILFRSTTPSPFPYTSAILSTIKRILNTIVIKQSISLQDYFERIAVGYSQLAADTGSGPLANEAVLGMLGAVINIVVRNCPESTVQRVADNVYTLFQPTSFDTSHIRLSAYFSSPSAAKVILSTWMLAALPKSLDAAVLLKGSIADGIEDLVLFASQTQSQTVELNCLRQIALYINKHLSNKDLTFASSLLDQTLQLLNSTDSDPGYGLRLCFFLTKALVLRLAPQSNASLENLINLLSSPNISIARQAALLFRAILAPDDVLSKENHAQIRLLAPQRVFQSLVPLISTRFRSSQSPAEKENYLIALSGILATVPSDIVMPELPTLLPLLLQSLDISDQNVKTATLETLAVVISTNPSALEESGHVAALTKRLLATAALKKNTGSSSQQTSLPRTRRLATRCITLTPKYLAGSTARANPLLSLKGEVLKGLLPVLDDPKRDVRKEAVDARAAWLRSVDDEVDDDDE
jgi:DNA repair/transcription protein MET18/MMS19